MESLEVEIQKVHLYKEFYNENKALFKSDTIQYWRDCTRYVTRKLDEFKSSLIGKLK